jgi:NAD(P)-dependent dehydrogenase (short-subunit alcohol dehydrogenase family)
MWADRAAGARTQLTDLKSVEKFAEAFLATKLPLHVLMLNAGIMMPPTKEISKQGHELQFAVNHLGGFYLTKLLSAKVLASGSERALTRVLSATPKPCERALTFLVNPQPQPPAREPSPESSPPRPNSQHTHPAKTLTRTTQPAPSPHPSFAAAAKETPARVVYVASEAAELWNGPGAGEGMAEQVPPTRAYHPLHCYSLSKALNILTAKEQQRRWGPDATAICVAIHPGIIKTNLLANAGAIEGAFCALLPGLEPRLSDARLLHPVTGVFGSLCDADGWPFLYAQKSIAQGASTQVYASVAEQVVAEVRAGAFYYYNNDKQTVWRASDYSDEVCKETWELSMKLLPK